MAVTFRPLGLDDPEEYIRGARALNALLSSSDVNTVRVAPGHIAAVFNSHRRLCLFDTVPKTQRFAEHEHQRVLRSLRSDEFQSLDRLNMLYVEFDVEIASIVLRQDNLRHTHVMAHLRTGEVYSWLWSSSFVWKAQGQVIVSVIAEKWTIVSAVYSTVHETYVWWQKYHDQESGISYHHVYARRLRFLDSSETVPFHMSDPISVLSFWHRGEAIDADFGLMQIGRSGVWLRGVGSLHFFHLPSCILHTLHDGDISTTSIASITVHTTGSQAVCLLTDGTTLSCVGSNDGITIKALCDLKMDVPVDDCIFFAHRYWLGILKGRSCSLYHATSSVLMHSLTSPAIVSSDTVLTWDHYPGVFGIWGRSGVWKLYGTRVVDEVSAIVQTPGCTYTDGVKMCEGWSLNRVGVKYALDHAIAARHSVERNQAIGDLAPKLSSPALLLGVLPDPIFHDGLVEQVREFVEPADLGTDGTNAEAHYASCARKSLSRFTVLNESLRPLLEKVVDLADRAKTINDESPVNEDTDVLSMSKSRLSAWVRDEPDKALPILEAAIQQRPITPIDSSDTYELICRASYHTTPQRLLSFIRSVHKAAPGPSAEYWVKRALDAIPPPSTSSGVVPAQIDAHVHLLSACGQSTAALKLCLNQGMWDRACQLVRGRSASGVDFYELLSLLLAYASKRSSKEWAEAAALAPSGLTSQYSLALLQALNDGTDNSVLMEDGSGVNVSTLKESIRW